MRSLLLAAISTTALATAACADETEAPAEDTAPAAEETAAPAAAQTDMAEDATEEAESPHDFSGITSGTYVLEKTHAYVTFSYSHLGYSHPILRWNGLDATVDLDTEDPAASSLEVTIDASSIDSGVEKFDEHLQSEDMFNVATYPEITFTSTDIDLDAGTLTGDLTMMGQTHPVTLDVELNGAGEHPMSGKEHFGISATGTLDRTEWGLGYAAPAVGTEVDLRIETEFNKAE